MRRRLIDQGTESHACATSQNRIFHNKKDKASNLVLFVSADSADFFAVLNDCFNPLG